MLTNHIGIIFQSIFMHKYILLGCNSTYKHYFYSTY